MEEIATEARFTALTTQKNKITLIDFHALWCGPCKVIEPAMAKLPAKFPNASFGKVDVDKLPEVASSQGIRAMPTIVLYLEGKQLDQVQGANMPAIEAMLQKHYAKSKSSTFEGQGHKLTDSTPAQSSSIRPATASGSAAQKGGWLSSLMGGLTSSANDHDEDLQAALLMSMESDLQTEGAKDGKPAELQIRFADGKTLKHTFSSRDTLGYVSKWVSTQAPGAFVLALAYPRRLYIGDLLNKTLEEEGLANRGQLLVIPK